jgi:hypothetical protein
MYGDTPGCDEGVAAGPEHRFSKSQIVGSTLRLIGEDVDLQIVARRPAQLMALACLPWAVAEGSCSHPADDRRPRLVTGAAGPRHERRTGAVPSPISQ